MARPVVTALAGAAAGLLLAALTLALPFREHARVIAGTLRLTGGEPTRAIVDYKRVDGRFAAYATFNLAVTYAALGEADAAERLLAELAHRGHTDAELLFRVGFNRGNLAFARGDYRAAVLGYRAALAVRAGDRDAKRNLELALRRLASGRGPGAAPTAETAGIGDGAAQLLRFAMQQEDTVWTSRPSDADTAESW